MNRGPIRKFLSKYANVYVSIQSHCLSAGALTHYVTANGVRNGLHTPLTHTRSHPNLARPHQHTHTLTYSKTHTLRLCVWRASAVH